LCAFTVVAVVVAVLGVLRSKRPHEFLKGDCPYYAVAAASLLNDGDFDLNNQIAPGLTGADLGERLREHSGFFALSPDGRVVPKHSVLMPLTAIPFLAVFGPTGLLVFNVVQLGVLVYGISLLAGDSPASRMLALAAYVSSPFLPYTYNFSPDVFGAALVVWTYVAAHRGWWVPCGLLAGAAVWAKVYLVVILLPAGLLVLNGGLGSVLKTVAAALVVVVPMLILNAALYGGPFVTGYDREARVQPDGTLTTADHYGLFNQPLITGLGRLLFDRELGAVWTAPLWGLWPVGAWLVWKQGRPRFAAALALGIVVNLLLFALYDKWNESVGGNRFLFPAFALGFSLQGPFWDVVAERLRKSRESGA
jgi:hypothetical protein